MPRLMLRFEDRVLRECPLGLMVTIGRLPDNNVIIDNPAVSSHHACIFRDGEDFVVEDLGSTNGTFVNGRRVARQALRDGDVLLVGKHTLVFDWKGGQAVPDEIKPLLDKLGQTVFLDTAQHRALLSTLNDVEALAMPASRARSSGGSGGAPGKGAVLRVRAGRADLPAYPLEAPTSVIGSSDTALVRLHGWFKPSVALAIARRSDGYEAVVLGGTTFVNGRRLARCHRLEDGDLLQVCGLTLEFVAADR